MAKRSAEPNDSDRIEGFSHPRETYSLLGQDLALARAARGLRAAIVTYRNRLLPAKSSQMVTAAA